MRNGLATAGCCDFLSMKIIPDYENKVGTLDILQQ